jgi:hypothetical protein
MANITAYGSVTETGILSLSNRKRLQEDLKKFKGNLVEVTIKKRNTRSNPQNKYLWGVLYAEIVIELKKLGNENIDADYVHEFCKKEFNPVQVFGPGGEVIGTIGGSTTDMNKSEMSDYWDKIIRWANEFLEITIPLPNEKLTFDF